MIFDENQEYENLSKEDKIKIRTEFAPLGWKDLEEPPCYDSVYLCSTMNYTRGAFLIVSRTPCNVIETLNHFLGCSCFRGYLHENPRYLNMSSLQLLECLSYDDGFDWKNTRPITNQDYDEDILDWVATLLVYFQWEYSIDFTDWLKYFSVEDVYYMYYPGHEASYQNICDKLYYIYLGKKEGITNE